jgi:phage N-6-adenine-methyltransferase
MPKQNGAAPKQNEWDDGFGALYTSSDRLDWGTPQALFAALDQEFLFDLDAAASFANKKCKRYIGPDHLEPRQRDALQISWGPVIKNLLWNVYLNPPYGRAIEQWYGKAYAESRKRGVSVVMLVNANTETTYWREYAKKADEIRFISGRIGYVDPTSGEESPTKQTKGSALVIWRWHSEGPPKVSWAERDELFAKGKAYAEAGRDLSHFPDPSPSLPTRKTVPPPVKRSARKAPPPPPRKS